MWYLGAGEFGEVGGVENEKEGCVASAVEHDREEQPSSSSVPSGRPT
jgi:hypothetical protein